MTNFKKSDINLLRQLVKIKSISGSSEVLNLAKELVRYIKSIGMDVKIHKTDNNCFVLAEYDFNREGKCVIFYSHFDVKPIYKFDKWLSSPFKLRVSNEKLWGRGVADCKGQLFSIIKSFEIVNKRKIKSISKVRFIFDGGEESGSSGLKEIISDNPNFFYNDLMIICDGSQENDSDFCIGFGARGQLDIKMNLEKFEKAYHPGKANNENNKIIQKLSTFVLELQNYFDTNILKKNKKRIFLGREVVKSKPSLTFTYIDSGRNDVSLVPVQGRLNFEIRITNNDSLDKLMNKVETLAREIDLGFNIYIKQKYLSLYQDLNNKIIKRRFFLELEKSLNKKIIFKEQLGFSLPIYPLIEKVPFLIIPLANPDSNNHSPNENLNVSYLENGINICKYILENAEPTSMLVGSAIRVNK